MSRTVFAMIFALTIGAFLAENLLYFPMSVPYMKKLAAGAPLLDMRPGYTPDDVYRLFDILTQSGRGAYLRLLWTIDLLLPALFSLFLSSAIRRGAFRASRSIPLLAAVCDYAENIMLTILLLRYPMHEPAFVQLASVFTVTKLVLYASGLLLAISGFLVRVVNHRLDHKAPEDATRPHSRWSRKAHIHRHPEYVGSVNSEHAALAPRLSGCGTRSASQRLQLTC